MNSSIASPYPNLNITNSENLLKVEGRFLCDKCKSSRKFFCYSCSKAHPNYKGEIPKVKVNFRNFSTFPLVSSPFMVLFSFQLKLTLSSTAVRSMENQPAVTRKLSHLKMSTFTFIQTYQITVKRRTR